MEPKLIFWIIGIILYFWIKSRKASSPQNPEENIPRPTGTAPGSPMTFEDLLREIQASKKPVKEQQARRIPEPRPFESYEEEETDESIQEVVPETEYSKESYTSTETFKAYEKAKSEAFQRASLEETMKVENTEVKFSKFAEYQTAKDPSPAEQIYADFRNPDTLKKYFIINEILNKKWT
jgi:hypothetical protein